MGLVSPSHRPAHYYYFIIVYLDLLDSSAVIGPFFVYYVVIAYTPPSQSHAYRAISLCLTKDGL